MNPEIPEKAIPTKPQVTVAVCAIIGETLGFAADNLSLESDLVLDLSANSLDLVELQMRLEDRFQTSLKNVEWEETRKVNDLIDIIWIRVERGIASA